MPLSSVLLLPEHPNTNSINDMTTGTGPGKLHYLEITAAFLCFKNQQLIKTRCCNKSRRLIQISEAIGKLPVLISIENISQ